MSLSKTQLISFVETQLQQRLPSSWTVDVEREPRTPPGRPDALLRLRSPDGRETQLLIEAKLSVEPRNVINMVTRLRRSTDAKLLVVAPFLGARAREELVAAGADYADSTGNLRLVLDDPAIFIETAGASSNPFPAQRVVPIRSLKGPSAARVARGLADFAPPYGIRQLAGRVGASPASVSRVVDLLDREALLTRGSRGAVATVDWSGMIRRWALDYSFTDSNRAETFLEPRGLDALQKKLAKTPEPYAVTGSLPAALVAPVASPRLAAVYVEDTTRAAGRLGLRAAEVGANVLLVEPLDPVVFDRTWSRDGVSYCALSQVAADLFSSPGRGPAEATELIRWMEANEDAWRT